MISVENSHIIVETVDISTNFEGVLYIFNRKNEPPFKIGSESCADISLTSLPIPPGLTVIRRFYTEPHKCSMPVNNLPSDSCNHILSVRLAC